MVLQNDAENLRLLTSREEKIAMLKSLGADDVEQLEFTREIASLRTADYLRLLCDRYAASAIVLGYDNRIGSDQLAPEDTAAIARSLGMEAVIVGATKVGGKSVSSTKIRNLIAAGGVREASVLLGRNYSLPGIVVGGKRLGRAIGFPTANLQPSDPLRLIPGEGVYLTSVRCLGREFFGMTNVRDVIETHIFDFDENIYGLDINVTFLERLRDEMDFSSVQELKNQLETDELSAKKLIFEQY